MNWKQALKIIAGICLAIGCLIVVFVGFVFISGGISRPERGGFAFLLLIGALLFASNIGIRTLTKDITRLQYDLIAVWAGVFILWIGGILTSTNYYEDSNLFSHLSIPTIAAVLGAIYTFRTKK